MSGIFTGESVVVSALGNGALLTVFDAAGREWLAEYDGAAGLLPPPPLFLMWNFMDENVFEDFNLLRILFPPEVAVPMLLVLSAIFLM